MISKRIKEIASLVEKGKNVVDIGCDHGFLDIYLTKNNQNKCIAVDINQNALNMAIKNIELSKLDIKTILSDGFNNITVGENTDCIIAGMGTNTIINILENPKRDSFDKFIIQTNNDYYLLRKYMYLKNYIIEDEITFIDKKIRYIIIKFKKGQANYSNLELMLGPILMKKENDDTKNYYKELYNKNIKIISNLPKSQLVKKIKLKMYNKQIKKLI